MKKIYLFIVLFSISAFSQKKVLDLMTHEPIAFVEMYAQNAILIGTTNFKGEITQEELLKIENIKTNKIDFHKDNYENKTLTINEFNKNADIYLNSNSLKDTINLVEVIVSRKKYKYTKLTAYFRSIQFNNKQPQYFMDGIAEYYIDNKSGKIKMNILKNRSYNDDEIRQIKENRFAYFEFNITGVPMIDDYMDYEKFRKEYTLRDVPTNILRVEKNNFEIGTIKKGNIYTNLDLQIYSENHQKKMKFLGIESTLKNYSVSAIYKGNKSQNILDNIVSFKESRDYYIKKKKDLDYTNIVCTNEIYVTSSENTDNLPKTKERYYSFKSNSNYDLPFWEDVKSNIITPLPNSVQTFIDEKLVKLK